MYKVHLNYGRIFKYVRTYVCKVCFYSLVSLLLFSEWSKLEEKLGTPLQITGGCMDRCVCVCVYMRACVCVCVCMYVCMY